MDSSLNTHLICLPGFLGEKKDFQGLESFFRDLPKFKISILDWMNEMPDPTTTPISVVGSWFGEKVLSMVAPGDQVVVLGYSLGGRLTLALREYLMGRNVSVKLRYVFVSTNPGIESADEKPARLTSDANWADRFLNEDWATVLSAWNQQAVFHGSVQEPSRAALESQRQKIARVLTNWSLARQKDFRPQLFGSDFIWMTGEKDSKLTELAKASPQIAAKLRSLPQASHRVHLDAPVELANRLLLFLDQP